MPEPANFLDPLILAGLQDLELAARYAVHGLFQGIHKSPFSGFSPEYTDRRPYVSGDDTRFIDWKAFARTDALYIKNFRQETNVHCGLVLDASASMNYASGKISKIDYACLLSASLAFLLLSQNDAAGLSLAKTPAPEIIPCKSFRQHLHLILSALGNIVCSGETHLLPALEAMRASFRGRSIIIIISDLLCDFAAMAGLLAELASARHEIMVFQILDPSELSFTFREFSEFIDPETGKSLRALGSSLASGYAGALADHQKMLRDFFAGHEIDYSLHTTDASLLDALHIFFQRRSRIQ
ncbi:MAG: hypothetical protein A2096_15790 [Spirochaetes bacterium GWF1_41_5]|nr:MAG: hypothetical protein A2096_15790 [Spirochaetes bacterium GWF1_41_5]HBE00896.1 hypothetical protein [Spirochaetia bacterium]